MAIGPGSIGKLRERLVVEENVPDPIQLTSLTRSAASALAVTAYAHGYATGDYVQIDGATPTGYTGKKQIIVTGATTFSYVVPISLATPATGTITVTYVSDPQGNRKTGWNVFMTLSAELIPVSATERLAAAAIPALASEVLYRFRIQARADLTDEMRIKWKPIWPPNASEKTLEITGLLPDGDGRRWQFVEAIE